MDITTSVQSDRFTSSVRPPQVISHHGDGWSAVPHGDLIPSEKLTRADFDDQETVRLTQRVDGGFARNHRFTPEGARTLAAQLNQAATEIDGQDPTRERERLLQGVRPPDPGSVGILIDGASGFVPVTPSWRELAGPEQYEVIHRMLRQLPDRELTRIIEGGRVQDSSTGRLRDTWTACNAGLDGNGSWIIFKPDQVDAPEAQEDPNATIREWARSKAQKPTEDKIAMSRSENMGALMMTAVGYIEAQEAGGVIRFEKGGGFRAPEVMWTATLIGISHPGGGGAPDVDTTATGPTPGAAMRSVLEQIGMLS